MHVCFCCFSFSVLSQEMAGKNASHGFVLSLSQRFCVEWDVKPQLSLTLSEFNIPILSILSTGTYVIYNCITIVCIILLFALS